MGTYVEGGDDSASIWEVGLVDFVQEKPSEVFVVVRGRLVLPCSTFALFPLPYPPKALQNVSQDLNQNLASHHKLREIVVEEVGQERGRLIFQIWTEASTQPQLCICTVCGPNSKKRNLRLEYLQCLVSQTKILRT